MAHVLMRHKATGGEARWAASAVDHARTLGWKTVRDKRTPNVPGTSPGTPEQKPDSGRNEE